MTTHGHKQGMGTVTTNNPVRINSSHSGAPLQRASEAHLSPESGMGGGQSVHPTHSWGTEKSVQELLRFKSHNVRRQDKRAAQNLTSLFAAKTTIKQLQNRVSTVEKQLQNLTPSASCKRDTHILSLKTINLSLLCARLQKMKRTGCSLRG